MPERENLPMGEVIARARRAQAVHDMRTDVQLELVSISAESDSEALWATQEEYDAYWRDRTPQDGTGLHSVSVDRLEERQLWIDKWEWID